MTIATGAFVAVYLFGWLAGSSPESTFVKGIVALVTTGSLGWLLTRVVSSAGEKDPLLEQKGKNIDITLE
jgi:hypothetical protein